MALMRVRSIRRQPALLDVDPHARREHDFYETPRWMTRALLRHVGIPHGASILEPCVGDWAIARVLSDLTQQVNVATNDIDQRRVADTYLDATARDSWPLMATPDLVITNPPFNDAFDIVRHAHGAARQGVIMLLRRTWDEPTDDRGDWLAAYPPTKEIVMPRWNFRRRDGKGGGDSATCAWFIWARNRHICTPGIAVISKRERDVLMTEADQ